MRNRNQAATHTNTHKHTQTRIKPPHEHTQNNTLLAHKRTPQGCGLVVEAHIIDERSEWRTFGDKDKEGDDPSRVGGAANALYEDGGLGTTIGRMAGDGGASHALGRMHARQNAQARQLRGAFGAIAEMCSKLNQSDAVKAAACEVYKNVRVRFF